MIKKGGLLLIERPFGGALSKATWDPYSEIEKYFKDQEEFVSKLSSEIKNKLIIKLPLELALNI